MLNTYNKSTFDNKFTKMKNKLPNHSRQKSTTIFLALVLSFISFTLNATPFKTLTMNSVSLEINHSNAPEGTSGWTLDATVNNVECYYKIVTCNGGSTILLKFNNKNTHSVQISWNELFNTQLESSLIGISGVKSLLLTPGETSEMDCNSAETALVVRTHQISATYPAIVSKFSFKNIQVVNIK